MRKLIRKIAILSALALAAPAWAQSSTSTTKEDAKDTATEKKAQTKKKARKAKPGGESASDKMKDAQDTGTEKKAQAKKKARKAGAETKKGAKTAEEKAKGSMEPSQAGTK
jgi:hypothetical protein